MVLCAEGTVCSGLVGCTAARQHCLDARDRALADTCVAPGQAVAKALREREEALLTVHALENELRQKRRGISSLEESGQQVDLIWPSTCDSPLPNVIDPVHHHLSTVVQEVSSGRVWAGERPMVWSEEAGCASRA